MFPTYNLSFLFFYKNYTDDGISLNKICVIIFKYSPLFVYLMLLYLISFQLICICILTSKNYLVELICVLRYVLITIFYRIR